MLKCKLVTLRFRRDAIRVLRDAIRVARESLKPSQYRENLGQASWVFPIFRQNLGRSGNCVCKQVKGKVSVIAFVTMTISDVNNNFSIVSFHSRDQQPCFATKTKENVCIIIKLNSRRIWSGLQNGGRDVIRKPRIVTMLLSLYDLKKKL